MGKAKTYRGKLHNGNIEWHGEQPPADAEVRVRVVKRNQLKLLKPIEPFIKFGMYGPPLDLGETVEEEIAFIKSLAEFDEEEHQRGVE